MSGDGTSQAPAPQQKAQQPHGFGCLSVPVRAGEAVSSVLAAERQLRREAHRQGVVGFIVDAQTRPLGRRMSQLLEHPAAQGTACLMLAASPGASSRGLFCVTHVHPSWHRQRKEVVIESCRIDSSDLQCLSRPRNDIFGGAQRLLRMLHDAIARACTNKCFARMTFNSNTNWRHHKDPNSIWRPSDPAR